MTKNKENNESRFSSFFQEFKENVTEGAKALGNMSADIFEDVKEKAEDVYETGSDKFDQAAGVVHSYVDQYKGEKEIKELSQERNELNGILGDMVFHEFKKTGSITKRFLTTKKSSELLNSIEKVDLKILQLGKALDKKAKSKKK